MMVKNCKRWSSIINNELFWYSLEVEDYKESLSSDFLMVEDDKESRRRRFSKVGHKHGTLWNISFSDIALVLSQNSYSKKTILVFGTLLI